MYKSTLAYNKTDISLTAHIHTIMLEHKKKIW